jgi:hypothetical protein
MRSWLRVSAATVLVLTASCGGPPAAPTVVAPAVSGLTATLTDQTIAHPAGQLSWRTTWELCWPPYSGAIGYQLQARTSEGTVDRVREHTGQCFQVEAASGVHAETEWRSRRTLLLELSAGQLAYRVRAVLPDHRVSLWSSSVKVGQQIPK